MQNDAIDELLKQLHAALQDAKTITDKDRDLLRQLSADIEAVLAKSGAPATKHPTLAGQIGDAVTRFEVTHPDLTDVLARVSKVLADMGI
jgi:ElaB/YqjD/DUF883 family membrane-anchored ribosome-binding protein